MKYVYLFELVFSFSLDKHPEVDHCIRTFKSFSFTKMLLIFFLSILKNLYLLICQQTLTCNYQIVQLIAIIFVTVFYTLHFFFLFFSPLFVPYVVLIGLFIFQFFSSPSISVILLQKTL